MIGDLWIRLETDPTFIGKKQRWCKFHFVLPVFASTFVGYCIALFLA